MISWLVKSMLSVLANYFRKDIEDVSDKTPDIYGLGSSGALNTKAVEAEKMKYLILLI